MLKIDLTSKQFIIYIMIMLFVSITFISFSHLLVDKLKFTTAFMYSLVAFPLAGLIKYILLLNFWKGKRK